MRTLNQLYLILWEEIKDKQVIDGLCGEALDLFLVDKITEFESHLLSHHLLSQKPSYTQHTEFMLNKRWVGGAWWWDINEDEDPVNRKLFIQKMIKITQNE
jgi:hypothetical protein